MNRSQFLLLGLISLLLLSSNNPTLAVDQSLIGVKDGEEYTFILQKYYFYHERPNQDTRIETTDYIYANEGSISLKDGDQFTYIIKNATTYDRTTEPIYSNGTVQAIGYFNPFAIDVEIIGPNGTKVTDELSVGFGTTLSPTNWTGFKTAIDESNDEFDKQRLWNPDITYTREIIDTKTDFGFRIGESFSGNDTDPNTYSDITEIRYEKSTGMLNLVDIEDISTETIGNETYLTEYINKFARKGYSPDDDETALLPGFTLYVSITALITIIYRHKRYPQL